MSETPINEKSPNAELSPSGGKESLSNEIAELLKGQGKPLLDTRPESFPWFQWLAGGLLLIGFIILAVLVLYQGGREGRMTPVRPPAVLQQSIKERGGSPAFIPPPNLKSGREKPSPAPPPPPSPSSEGGGYRIPEVRQVPGEEPRLPI